jgi:hypothetical protein
LPDVIEVIDTEKLTLSVLNYANGTAVTIPNVTDVQLIYSCLIPLEEQNSVVVLGGDHRWNTNRCHIFFSF